MNEYITRFNDLPMVRLDEKISAIQVGEDEGKESFGQRECVLYKEVFSFSLEGVLFLLNDKHYISRDGVRLLPTHKPKKEKIINQEKRKGSKKKAE